MPYNRNVRVSTGNTLINFRQIVLDEYFDQLKKKNRLNIAFAHFDAQNFPRVLIMSNNQTFFQA